MIFAKNSKKTKFYGTHILVWVLFIIYESIITIVLTGKFWTLLDYFNSYFINIVLFYVNAHLVLPYSHKKPFYITAAFILLELICSTLLKYSLSEILLYLKVTADSPFKNMYTGLSYTVWRFIYFMGLSAGYWFALNTIIERKKVSDLEKKELLSQLQNEQLEKKLADSEIAYLKAQINPHFLFNTLNFLYNSALKTSVELSEPILLLSDIMRYALTETPQSGKVNLEDEIEQINTFIDLNQFRFDHNLQLSFNVSGNAAGIMILPLILLTPIENIFKYGDLKNTSHPATINLVIRENQLHLTSINRKLKSRRHIPSNGVGLKNLKLRLDAYYSDAHQIHVSENEDDYIFDLQITL
ncbi:sensor histidine kinase [Pedobacter hartonius]|uniref:Histidine kinase n=1 Tax=Pedobacter hartonius TaxID=425514 RepID=A0A1H4AUG8_9SPHI|nr:sensor histidine kinase [Pedobacter hartonius]SEA39447.1 Histidine kinase [Pedobacter hartonius]